MLRWAPELTCLLMAPIQAVERFVTCNPAWPVIVKMRYTIIVQSLLARSVLVCSAETNRGSEGDL